MSEQLNKGGKKFDISVLKGPCLAKELARQIKSSTIVANKNINKAKSIGKMISTKYYLIEYSKDVVGVEICSAIKNIYSLIIGSVLSLNKSSSLFQKSLSEMKYITKSLKGKEDTVLSLANPKIQYLKIVDFNLYSQIVFSKSNKPVLFQVAQDSNFYDFHNALH